MRVELKCLRILKAWDMEKTVKAAVNNAALKKKESVSKMDTSVKLSKTKPFHISTFLRDCIHFTY